MEYHEFYQRLIRVFPVGASIANPGGGDTTIVSYTSTQMAYKRGKSIMRVSIVDLYDTYQKYRGKTVTTNDLRGYAPHIYDSKESGHSCNCTVLFMALKAMGIVTRIRGEGAAGNPFWVAIPAEENFP